jgi:hypothetical protein
MVRQFAMLFFILSFPTLLFAQLETTLNFNGELQDSLKIDGLLSVIRPVTIQVPGTCVRQVPHQENVCRDVTRYRQECHNVPSSQSCSTQYDNVCHPVTRTREQCTAGPSQRVCHENPTRQECTSGPSRQVCHDRPPREECTSGPSRQVCHQNPSRQECSSGPSRQECSERPSRQVCTERPTHQVCHTNPVSGQQVCATVGGGQSCQTVGGGQDCRTVPGEQSCRTVGGGQSCDSVPGDRICRTVSDGQACATIPGEQSCRTVGGGQSCETVPGDDICRTVSYQDQECEQVPREVCRTIPSHKECEDIPYSQNVCGPETVFTSQEYACMKDEVQQLNISKKVSANIAVDIKTNNLMGEFPILMTLKGEQAENTSFALAASLDQDPSLLVVVKSKKIEITSENKDQIMLDGTISLEMIDPKTVQTTFPKSFGDIILTKKTSKLLANINGTVAEKGSVDLIVMNGRKQVAVLKAAYPSEKIQIVKDRRQTSIAIDLMGLITERISVDDTLSISIKLGAGLNIEGEILNVKKPVNEKLFSKLEGWVE